MGILEVQVLAAKGIPKVQRLGVQDPYVVLSHGGAKRRTRTCNNGGQSPVFQNEVHSMPLDPSKPLEIVIYNDRGLKDDVIGKAQADLGPVLQRGSVDAAHVVYDASGRPQGSIHLIIKAAGVSKPKPPAAAPAAAAAGVAEATKAVESMSVGPSPEAYNQALSDARAKYYADVATAMVPHNAVAGAMAEAFFENVKEIKEEEEREMGKIFDESKGKVGALLGDAMKEWTSLGMEFRTNVVDELVKHDPDAKEKYAKQLESLSSNLLDNGTKAKGALDGAQAELLEGMAALLDKYKASLGEAVHAYEVGFKRVLGGYKDSVEDLLKEKAEKRSREEAAKYGPPPREAPPARSAPPPAAAAPAPAPSAYPQYSAPPAQAPPAAYPQYAPPAHSGPPPAAAMAGAAAAGAAAASSHGPSAPYTGGPPPPSQYPYAPPPQQQPQGNAYGQAPPAGPTTEQQLAQTQVAMAQQQAYYSQQQAAQAQQQAEMQRQAAAEQQRKMEAAILVQHRRRAVRRGVVGGVVMAKVLF